MSKKLPMKFISFDFVSLKVNLIFLNFNKNFFNKNLAQRITKRSRPLLRKIKCLMAKAVIKHNCEIREKYLKLRKKEKIH